MRKRVILFLISMLFFILTYSATSLRVFEINETGKISLGLKAEDPDADRLTYTFSKPLNKEGEWQTNYGDAGEYSATITVSDSKDSVTENILIIVHKKEEKPIIEDFFPKTAFIAIEEGNSIRFQADVSDVNKGDLELKWFVDTQIASSKKEMIFETGYEDEGRYKVIFLVSDRIYNVSKEWDVEVQNVDLDALMRQIKDIEVTETETVSLELPDFKKYKLSYTISEPIGNNNKWQTTYDNAGEYTVKVEAEGKGFKGFKDVKVAVKNKDRSPQLINLKNAVINENEKVTINVDAVDLDNDKIEITAENMPETASFDGSSFEWTPSDEFVKKSNAFNYLLDKLRILSRSIYVTFRAKSNELYDEKRVKITVKDVNSPFVLDKIEDIEVSEGEEVVIEPKYEDPDNDKVSFYYSGFMDSYKKKTGFNTAGLYVVKITATDGFFTETRFVNVKVNNANRKLLFDKVEDGFEVLEGQELKFELSATDADNDVVSFSAKKMPKGAKLKDNLFIWKPTFDTVEGKTKEFSIDFIASDGKDEVEKRIKVIVNNVNQAPKIINASNTLIAVKDKPILFEVSAFDGDGDELEYEWNFGFFDKFVGEDKHQRIFTTKGTKEVKVTVSDGIEKVSKVWDVEVV